MFCLCVYMCAVFLFTGSTGGVRSTGDIRGLGSADHNAESRGLRRFLYPGLL